MPVWYRCYVYMGHRYSRRWSEQYHDWVLCWTVRHGSEFNNIHIFFRRIIGINICFGQGFLNLQWSRWKRVTLTRLVAILPTFYLSYFTSINDLSGMNDILNAVMSLQLPFAVIPVVAFTSNRHIMGEFVNGRSV